MGDEILPHLKITSKSHALLGEVNSKRVSQSGKHKNLDFNQEVGAKPRLKVSICRSNLLLSCPFVLP